MVLPKADLAGMERELQGWGIKQPFFELEDFQKLVSFTQNV